MCFYSSATVVARTTGAQARGLRPEVVARWPVARLGRQRQQTLRLVYGEFVFFHLCRLPSMTVYPPLYFWPFCFHFKFM